MGAADPWSGSVDPPDGGPHASHRSLQPNARRRVQPRPCVRRADCHAIRGRPMGHRV